MYDIVKKYVMRWPIFGQHFIRSGTKLYRQVVGIHMGTNCAPLVADLFLFRYEWDFVVSLSDDKQADIIYAFNATSRYMDDILNISNVYMTIWWVTYALQDSGVVGRMPLIPRPRFWTCICPFLVVLFLSEFMINRTLLTLKLSVSRFWMVVFLAL